MKIKGFVIAGLIVLFVGVCLTIFAATRNDFSLNEVIDDTSYEEEVMTYDNVYSKISISCDVDSVEIKTHDKDNIEVVGKKGDKLYYSYRDNNNELRITQNIKKNIFGISYNVNVTKPLCIYLPKDTSISLNVEVDVGDVSIEDLSFTNMYFDLDCGNLVINNCEINTLNCELDLGNLETTNVNVSNIDAALDCGNIEFDGKISSRGEFELDLGNLDLTLLGTASDYRINNSGSGNAVIRYELDLGDFSVDYKE